MYCFNQKQNLAEDKAFLTQSKWQDHIRMMNEMQLKLSLQSVFPKVDLDALDFLSKMLTFNPYLRPSARELLEHSYLDEVREEMKQQREKQLLEDDMVQPNVQLNDITAEFYQKVCKEFTFKDFQEVLDKEIRYFKELNENNDSR